MPGGIIFEHNGESSDYRAMWGWLLKTAHSIKHYPIMESCGM